MASGKLWDYVASGARALGGLGPLGRSGGLAGSWLVKSAGGVGRPGSTAGFGASPAGGGGLGGPLRAGSGGMVGPQALSRPELERLRWTDRAGGCVPDARHVQVADVVRRVLRGGGRSASVSVRIPVGLPVVVADARRLEAALAGLVDHAVRRNPPGVRVLVRIDPVPGPGGPGGLGFPGFPGSPEVPAGELARVELRVVDQGPSELPEARHWLPAGVRAAEPGGPADGREPGGAGDAAGPSVPALVRAAGGRLGVEQTPGGGVTVVLVLTVAGD
ncbi:hypothetical protein [Streptomyces sp. BE20]|uniref:hypothetical protein n=1 Tax=Streptomycetaceae TaxID=2062 RepID=UPI002E76B838|nr:hypothetical protein [Streptomyces sp. BE20]MEE1822521.1 hypothetical protein [Streptomyces sp. BE20]